PRRQLLRARLAPARAGRDEDPLVLEALQLDGLAGGIDGDVELGGAIADLEDICERGVRSEQHRDGNGETHGRETAGAAHRCTAISSSIHMPMYLGFRGPSYLRSLKNTLGVDSTPFASPWARSVSTCAAAAS